MTGTFSKIYRTFRRRGEISSPPPSPRTAALRAAKAEPSYEPLLTLGWKEEACIVTSAAVCGLGQASVVFGAAEMVTAQFAALTAAAALGEVVTFGGVAGIGIVGNAYKAYKQVVEEQEKIINLNKELFILFNLAADKYDKIPLDKKEDVFSDERYRDIISEIYHALSIDKKHAELINNKFKNKTCKTPDDIKHLHLIIKRYATHRKGSVEKELWDTVLRDNFNLAGEHYINHFLKFNDVKSAIKYFYQEKQKRTDEYQTHVAELRDLLRGKEEKAVSEFNRNLDELLRIANNYGHSVFHAKKDGVSSAMCVEAKEQSSIESEAELFYSEFKKAEANLKLVLEAISSEELKGDLNKIWQFNISPLVEGVGEHLRNLPKSIKAIQHTREIFNPKNGTFRQFCQGMRGQEVEESIPLNLEKLLPRSRATPALLPIGMVSAVAFYGLYTTGKGLYLASIALGAAALSSTVLGLIVVGVALGLTLLAAYCYYRAQKNQMQRKELTDSLSQKRQRLIGHAAAPAVDDEKEVKTMESSQKPGSPTLFAQSALPVRFHHVAGASPLPSIKLRIA